MNENARLTDDLLEGMEALASGKMRGYEGMHYAHPNDLLLCIAEIKRLRNKIKCIEEVTKESSAEVMRLRQLDMLSYDYDS